MLKSISDASAHTVQGKYTVTLIPCDGIGPEISEAVKDIYTEANVRVPHPLVLHLAPYALRRS